MKKFEFEATLLYRINLIFIFDISNSRNRNYTSITGYMDNVKDRVFKIDTNCNVYRNKASSQLLNETFGSF